MTKEHPAVELLSKAITASKPVKFLVTLVAASTFFGVALSSVFGAIVLDRVLGRNWTLLGRVSTIISTPVLLLGLYFTASTAAQFFATKGSPVPFNPPPKLVDAGLYKYSRNPMLTGVYIMLTGVGILLLSPSILLLDVPIWILIMNWWVAAVEEPELEKRLGSEYLDYKSRVPRWGVKLNR